MCLPTCSPGYEEKWEKQSSIYDGGKPKMATVRRKKPQYQGSSYYSGGSTRSGGSSGRGPRVVAIDPHTGAVMAVGRNSGQQGYAPMPGHVQPWGNQNYGNHGTYGHNSHAMQRGQSFSSRGSGQPLLPHHQRGGGGGYGSMGGGGGGGPMGSPVSFRSETVIDSPRGYGGGHNNGGYNNGGYNNGGYNNGGHNHGGYNNGGGGPHHGGGHGGNMGNGYGNGMYGGGTQPRPGF